MLAIVLLARCWNVALVVFFNDTATTEIYTLSLHDALPISRGRRPAGPPAVADAAARTRRRRRDRKSTRLNSSHLGISYAVFCLKKKTTHIKAETVTLAASPAPAIDSPVLTRPRPRVAPTRA